MSNIVIIGNGIAGITAARHIRQYSREHRITVISAESKYFFSRTALMYVYMGHMKFTHTQPYENHYWRQQDINLIQARVSGIDTAGKQLTLDNGNTLPYDTLILALGSKPRPLPVAGTDLAGVQSLYSKQDLELMEANTPGVRQAVVSGGGLIGVEMAEMLHSRGIEVSMVVREDGFWNIVLPKEESDLVGRHIESRGVKLLLSKNITAIRGQGRVQEVALDDGSTLPCQFVGITIGVIPNIDLVKDSPIEVNRGILVDEYLQTNIPGIYAIGDCAELRQPPAGRRAIEPVWYTGRLMGEAASYNICHDQPLPYNPGIWFNSAKFFDLEYQTYGLVPASARTGADSFYWQDDKGERALRLAYNDQQQLTGINSLGIRLRHEVADRWIREGVSLEYALAHFNELQFDPEFYPLLNFTTA